MFHEFVYELGCTKVADGDYPVNATRNAYHDDANLRYQKALDWRKGTNGRQLPSGAPRQSVLIELLIDIQPLEASI